MALHDDLLTKFETGRDLHPFLAAHAGFDATQPSLAVLDDKDHAPGVTLDNGVSRHDQLLLEDSLVDGDAGQHTRTQTFLGIIHFDFHWKRAVAGVGLNADGTDFSWEGPTVLCVKCHLNRLSFLEFEDSTFRDVDFNEQLAEVEDFHKSVPFANKLSGFGVL